MTEPVVEYGNRARTKVRRSYHNLFLLLSATILSAGIFGGCYMIALSNRYMHIEDEYCIFDKWERKFHSAEGGYYLFQLDDIISKANSGSE